MTKRGSISRKVNAGFVPRAMLEVRVGEDQKFDSSEIVVVC